VTRQENQDAKLSRGGGGGGGGGRETHRLKRARVSTIERYTTRSSRAIIFSPMDASAFFPASRFFLASINVSITYVARTCNTLGHCSFCCSSRHTPGIHRAGRRVYLFISFHLFSLYLARLLRFFPPLSPPPLLLNVSPFPRFVTRNAFSSSRLE